MPKEKQQKQRMWAASNIPVRISLHNYLFWVFWQHFISISLDNFNVFDYFQKKKKSFSSSRISSHSAATHDRNGEIHHFGLEIVSNAVRHRWHIYELPLYKIAFDVESFSQKFQSHNSKWWQRHTYAERKARRTKVDTEWFPKIDHHPYGQ